MRTSALVIGMALSESLIGGTPSEIVGTWKLVSASASTPTGDKNDAPFGENPAGLITYAANGRVMVIVSHDGRVPLSGADRIASPVPERAEAFATFFAYAGRYTVSGDRVIHHVEISSVQNWVNTDLVRTLSFSGNRLTLQTPPLSVAGEVLTSELVWERVE
jgi:hypothetical protein